MTTFKQYKENRDIIIPRLYDIIITLKDLLAKAKTINNAKEIDDLGLWHKFFLCNMSSGLVKRYIMNQKPTKYRNKEFYHNKYYDGMYIWWSWNPDNHWEFLEVIEEKIRFITHIKDRL